MCGLDLIEAVLGYLLQDLDASDAPSPVIRQKVKDGGWGWKKKAARAFTDWIEQVTPKGSKNGATQFSSEEH